MYVKYWECCQPYAKLGLRITPKSAKEIAERVVNWLQKEGFLWKYKSEAVVRF